jgi:hypothetical protein
MIIYEGKELPDTFQGYKTADLLKTWEEIRTGGTKVSKDQVEAMRDLLAEYRLGIHGLHDKALKKKTNSQ